MKYQYSAVFDPSKPTAPHRRRPIIEIELFGPLKNVSIFGALVDSGADNILINAESAKYVGINLDKAKKKESVTGIDGKAMETHFIDVDIKIKEFTDKVKVEVGFVPNLAVHALLGQIGFFDNYRIKFERDHNTFEIIPIKV